MLRKNTSKTKTVSEKITDLLIRNANGKDESSDDQGEEPRVEDEFDEYDLPDARTSAIRKQNVKLLSEQSVRYRGKISSRNELEDENESDSSESEEEADEDDYTSDDEDNDGALKVFSEKLNGASNSAGANASIEDDSDDDMDDSAKFINNNEDSDEDVNSLLEEVADEEGDEDEDDEEDDIESDDDDASDEANEDGTDIIAATNRHAEVQKGQCVQNQLQIWERLLEMRINTQKIISKSNQLPALDALKSKQAESERLTSVCNETVNSTSKLLSALLQLQNAFSQQFSEQRAALKKSLKRPLPIYDAEKDNAVPLKRFAEHIDAHFQEFKPYRNTVLLKWDDRTKLLTPGAGAKKKSLTEDYDIIRKIENTLQNRATLVKKSQALKGGTDDTIGDNDTENAHKQQENAELYDDSDFYHQQLRELIEYKTNTSVSAGEVAQQYMELQKLRQKMKKKVDTRASKGRKLRYTVHNKLINFMAPDDTTTWTDESKDELYRSLFAA